MRNNRIQVSACIVLYKNDIDLLERAISSFLDTDLKVKLYLIDNSPTSLLSFLADQSADVEYFHNPSNPGFGAGHNLAIEKILEVSSYHLVLNPDIYFSRGTLEKLYEFMELHQDIGQVMPKVLYPDGTMQYLCKKNPTPFDLFARRFMPKFIHPIFKKRMDEYEYKDKDYDQMMYDIPYLSGCFMFFRTSALKAAGFFDERIFMYIEDADITRRMLAIARTAYFPEAIVYHHFAKGSHKNWRLTMYSVHGAWVYFNKWGWTGDGK
ncbi:glycosyltransferase family 2 protein [Pedobacter sp. AW31-3R]|uniref:glycosyltransferase family 2 protein n=1 Tax=Pedobacter sp. AW31-3R TaxID=3445781 RepID=UPI003FA0E749